MCHQMFYVQSSNANGQEANGPVSKVSIDYQPQPGRTPIQAVLYEKVSHVNIETVLLIFGVPNLVYFVDILLRFVS